MWRCALPIFTLVFAGCSEDETLLTKGRAMIQVEPRILELTELAITEVSLHPITIISAGDGALTVQSVELVGDGLELRPSSLPVILRPETRTQIEVVVSYVDIESVAGTLLITSDAPDRPTVAVPVRARFTAPALPDAGEVNDDADPHDTGPLDTGVAHDAGFPTVCGEGIASNLLVDPGFSNPPALGLPQQVGLWVGDQTELVQQEGGAQPPSAPHMLAFRASGVNGPSAGQASQVHQIIDMAPFASRIASGARLLACGSFNRVVGSATSDRQFTVYVRGYQGLPGSFISQYTAGTQAFGPVRTDIASDNDPSTWERPCLDVPLPPPVDFLGIELRVREDVLNEELTPEFDGHFADDVCLAIVPD